MSVTRVEAWLANPYAIFAQEILRLQKLPELGVAPGAALRGSIVHEIMNRFAKAFPETLPQDAERALLQIANDVLRQYAGHPRVAAFWLPRFERFARWFAQTEPARRDGTIRVAAEVDGTLPIAAPAGLFTLRARADRIDVCDNGLIITDYKTGLPPSDKDVARARAPQLLLEAAIAQGEIGFTGIARKPVTGLRYIRASGGEPPGEERLVKIDDIAAHAESAVESLSRLIASFDIEATPYKAVRRARFSYDYDDYAHLARVGEWAALGEDEGAGS
jgi:ATP-dependent helicase/nuclease subunit B